MTERLVLAYDVGTSGVKAVLAGERRGLLASRSAGYPLSFTRTGWVEQDPAAIRRAVATATRALLRDAGPAATVEGIALTAQMFNLQPADAAGQTLGPMLSWLDQRAAAHAERLARHVPAERQFAALGSVVTAKDIVPRVLWLRDQQPERWEQTRWLLDCKEAAVLWLTGEAVIDPSGASAFRLTDARGAWDAGSCRLVDVPMDRLPPVRPATAAAGALRPEPAAELGLPAGTPVFVGTGDVPASQLGSGALEPGDAHLSLGTAVYLGIAADRPLRDPGGRLGPLAHAIPDAWVLWLEIATGGAALRWIGRALANPAQPDRPVADTQDERLASGVADEMDGLLFAPWLSGERVPLFDDAARGAFVGLSLRHGRAHLVRAVMEGVAYQIRWAWEYGLAYGVEPQAVRAVGGGGIGRTWLGIIADTLGRPLEVVEAPQDAAAVGAAAIAFVGLGAWSDLRAVGRLVRVEHRVEPDGRRAAAAERGFARFRALYAALAPSWSRDVDPGAPAASARMPTVVRAGAA